MKKVMSHIGASLLWFIVLGALGVFTLGAFWPEDKVMIKQTIERRPIKGDYEIKTIVFASDEYGDHKIWHYERVDGILFPSLDSMKTVELLKAEKVLREAEEILK